jgi:hypothetical protein
MEEFSFPLKFKKLPKGKRKKKDQRKIAPMPTKVILPQASSTHTLGTIATIPFFFILPMQLKLKLCPSFFNVIKR